MARIFQFFKSAEDNKVNKKNKRGILQFCMLSWSNQTGWNQNIFWNIKSSHDYINCLSLASSTLQCLLMEVKPYFVVILHYTSVVQYVKFL